MVTQPGMSEIHPGVYYITQRFNEVKLYKLIVGVIGEIQERKFGRKTFDNKQPAIYQICKTYVPYAIQCIPSNCIHTVVH